MNKKKYFFIILSILSVIIILVFFFVFKSKSDNKKNIENNIASQSASYAKLELDEQNYKLAQEKKDASFCQKLSEPISQTLCLQELARNSLSTSTCLLISKQESQEACVKGVNLNKIISDKDLANCESLADYYLARNCVENIAQANQDTDCSKINNEKLHSSCLTVINYNKAKQKNDSALCLDIPDLTVRANCLSELNNIDLHSDADNDGLDFLNEIINNTNPNKFDTDGDSYADLQEVNDGFNPAGDGKIENYEEKCSDITEPGIKELCLKEFIDGTLDYSHCNSIKDPGLLSYCLKKSNLNNKKPVSF